MKHLLQATAHYKTGGHQTFRVRITLIGRNINCIEEVPLETPEYLDGVLCRLELPNGRWVLLTDKYQDVIDAWHQTLEDSL